MLKRIEKGLYAYSDKCKNIAFRRIIFKFIKAAYYSAIRSHKDGITVHAAALSYNSILAIVPIVAVILALSRSLGLDSIVENLLRESLGEHQEALELILGAVNQYLVHLKGGVVLGVGILIWIYSIITIFREIEGVLNGIWRTKSSRSLVAMFADYTAFVFFMFIAIVLMVGLSTVVTNLSRYFEPFWLIDSTVVVIITILHWFIAVLFFTCLYHYIPNGNLQISLKASFCSGAAQGVLFLTTQYFLVNCQMLISSYSFSYGSLSAVPMLFLWIYITWMGFEFFGQLAYVWQNYDLGNTYDGEPSSRLAKYHCIKVMDVICKGFTEGEHYYDLQDICDNTGIIRPYVRKALQLLQEDQLIVETSLETEDMSGNVKSKRVFIPTRDSSNLRPGDLISILDSFGYNKAEDEQWNEFESFVNKYNESINSIFVINEKDKEK